MNFASMNFAASLMRSNINERIMLSGNRPLRAFWQELCNASSHGSDLAMAIVLDSSCGIERRSEQVDELQSYRIANTIVSATPLALALYACRNDVAEALLAAGADYYAFDGRGMSPLTIAAIAGNVSAIELLVSYGAKPAAFIDIERKKVLHYVAVCATEAVVEVLVRFGASLSDVDIHGRTPLHLAVGTGDITSVAAFIKFGANVDARDNEDKTPLHRIAYNSTGNAKEILIALLHHGAEVDVVDRGGTTPIYGAARGGNVEVIKALLSEGASLAADYEGGSTPLETFVLWNHDRSMPDADMQYISDLLTLKQ